MGPGQVVHVHPQHLDQPLPDLYQWPLPLTTSTVRPPPPYQDTSSRCRCSVAATTTSGSGPLRPLLAGTMVRAACPRPPAAGRAGRRWRRTDSPGTGRDGAARGGEPGQGVRSRTRRRPRRRIAARGTSGSGPTAVARISSEGVLCRRRLRLGLLPGGLGLGWGLATGPAPWPGPWSCPWPSCAGAWWPGSWSSWPSPGCDTTPPTPAVPRLAAKGNCTRMASTTHLCPSGRRCRVGRPPVGGGGPSVASARGARQRHRRRRAGPAPRGPNARG